jgi:hypothetical protein
MNLNYGKFGEAVDRHEIRKFEAEADERCSQQYLYGCQAPNGADVPNVVEKLQLMARSITHHMSSLDAQVYHAF